MSRKFKFGLTAIVILLMFGMFVLYISKYGLTTSHYEVTTDKIMSPIRIVQLTDLHNSTFGNNNQQLLSEVSKQSPDLIVLTGDVLNSDEENISIAVHLIEKLTTIASVYVSYGNHEKDYEVLWGTDLKKAFEQAGAHVLEFSYEDIEINGQWLRLGGLYGYCTPAKYLKTKEANPEECAFLEEFQSTESYSILLTHMPFAWIVNDGISEWKIDCVFTGHDHGGLIRIPLIGGLYAPDQGWFPGKDCGLYYSKDKEKVMVLSRGLGKSRKIPRFNNVPEIVVVDILPE